MLIKFLFLIMILLAYAYVRTHMCVRVYYQSCRCKVSKRTAAYLAITHTLHTEIVLTWNFFPVAHVVSSALREALRDPALRCDSILTHVPTHAHAQVPSLVIMTWLSTASRFGDTQSRLAPSTNRTLSSQRRIRMRSHEFFIFNHRWSLGSIV